MKKIALLLSLFAFLFVYGCGNSMENTQKVVAGDMISVDYIGRTEDGKVFDTSIAEEAKKVGLFNEQRTYEPLSFIVGARAMIPGFDEGVVGMTSGQTKTIKFGPEKGYGMPDQENIITTGIALFTEAGYPLDKVVKGAEIPFGPTTAKVLDRTETGVTLDFNHPLAGKVLEFEVTIRSIQSGSGSTNTGV